MHDLIEKNTIWSLKDISLSNNDKKISYKLPKKVLVKDIQSNWVYTCIIREDNYHGYSEYFHISSFLHWYELNQTETDLLVIQEII